MVFKDDKFLSTVQTKVLFNLATNDTPYRGAQAYQEYWRSYSMAECQLSSSGSNRPLLQVLARAV